MNASIQVSGPHAPAHSAEASPVTWTERAMTIDCAGDILVAVLSLPANQALQSNIGMVIITGGPQYRAGSHRQFVHLARAASAAGHAVLRFDVRGMGDSTGGQRSFETLDADIAAALDALQRAAPWAEQVVLTGLCDGAAAAWLYMGQTHDRRVEALCLANPWVRNEVTLARTHVKHYYGQRMRQGDFWLRLISGKVGADALKSLLRNLQMAVRSEGNLPVSEQVPFPARMATSCSTFGGPQLILLSGADLTAQEFIGLLNSNTAWAEAVADIHVKIEHLADADHTFSMPTHSQQFERVVLKWLDDLSRSRMGAATQP